MRRPFVIAHRGASGLAGEDNTLASFERAIEIGCDYVEFDVRRTSDLIPVCFHDPEINGISVSKLSHEELKQQAGLEVPSLKEMAELTKGRIKLDVELKEKGYEEEVVSIITRCFSLDEFMVKSFHNDILNNVSICNPEIKTGLLVGADDEKAVSKEKLEKIHKRLELCGCAFLSPEFPLLRQGLLGHDAISNYEIYVWTVNNPEDIEDVLSYPIQGIISDHPDRVLKLIDLSSGQV